MITCFLIDDDKDDHDFFKMAIDQINHGINVHFAEDGREGLNMLPVLQPRPDVIFLDLNMPLLGGLEFLNEFKTSSYKDIPVIMYSTCDERFFQQKALEHGALGYLTKPSTVQALKNGLLKILKELNLL